MQPPNREHTAHDDRRLACWTPPWPTPGTVPRRDVVKLPEAKRDFAWASRVRRLARDFERLTATLAGLHFLTLACLMLHRFTVLTLSP